MMDMAALRISHSAIHLNIHSGCPLQGPSVRNLSSPTSITHSSLQLQDGGKPRQTKSMCLVQEFESRSSAEEVKKEILMCYDLIKKLGKGVVYLGSSRTKPDHPHFVQSMELAHSVAMLLDCTTWTGAGPGIMDAVLQGALKAGKPVGGFKISKEAGEWTSSKFHPYLENHVYYTCRFFSARKHGLVDAAVRDQLYERTAFVALPGGIGTVDEVFEILVLKQLGRIGSKYPVPFLLMNYDGFYTKLLDFLGTCMEWGFIAKGQMGGLWVVCETNDEALKYLANFYGIEDKSDKIS